MKCKKKQTKYPKFDGGGAEARGGGGGWEKIPRIGMGRFHSPKVRAGI